MTKPPTVTDDRAGSITTAEFEVDAPVECESCDDTGWYDSGCNEYLPCGLCDAIKGINPLIAPLVATNADLRAELKTAKEVISLMDVGDLKDWGCGKCPHLAEVKSAKQECQYDDCLTNYIEVTRTEHNKANADLKAEVELLKAKVAEQDKWLIEYGHGEGRPCGVDGCKWCEEMEMEAGDE